METVPLSAEDSERLDRQVIEELYVEFAGDVRAFLTEGIVETDESGRANH